MAILCSFYFSISIIMAGVRFAGNFLRSTWRENIISWDDIIKMWKGKKRIFFSFRKFDLATLEVKEKGEIKNERMLNWEMKHMDEVSNLYHIHKYSLYPIWLDAMKSIFIANLSTNHNTDVRKGVRKIFFFSTWIFEW